MAGTYEVPAIGSSNESQEPKIKTFIESWNGKLDATNSLEGKNLSLGTLGRWYAPTIIATEQERENVAFGKLTTADEVAGVVLPTNGLIVIGYLAKWKSSVAAAGRAAVFLGATQLKNAATAAVQEAEPSGTALRTLSSFSQGLTDQPGEAAFPTSGAALAPNGTGGVCYVFAEAGTYAISIQFKATSGKVAVKERKLWVGVVGV
jgi:hypothetical protein